MRHTKSGRHLGAGDTAHTQSRVHVRHVHTNMWQKSTFSIFGTEPLINSKSRCHLITWRLELIFLIIGVELVINYSSTTKLSLWTLFWPTKCAFFSTKFGNLVSFRRWYKIQDLFNFFFFFFNDTYVFYKKVQLIQHSSQRSTNFVVPVWTIYGIWSLVHNIHPWLTGRWTWMLSFKLWGSKQYEASLGTDNRLQDRHFFLAPTPNSANSCSSCQPEQYSLQLLTLTPVSHDSPASTQQVVLDGQW